MDCRYPLELRRGYGLESVFIGGAAGCWFRAGCVGGDGGEGGEIGGGGSKGKGGWWCGSWPASATVANCWLVVFAVW